VDYLTSQSLCRNLDEGLTPLQTADAVAYSSFLRANAAPLLDLSLYVSAANWSATTRPEYSRLLAFPLTWTIPPLIRGEAIKRTDHLGLAELDTDFDPNGSLHLTAGRDALPETFRRHLPAVSKKTVKEEMTPEQAAAIRLFSITEECMSTLSDMLVADEEGKPPRFLRREFSSLDCLAFGYLALMRDAPVPRSFLQGWMTQKATRLSAFLDDVKSNHLPSLEDLPLESPDRTTALGFGARLLDSTILHIPEVGSRYAEDKRVRAEKGTSSLVDSRSLFLAFCVVTGAALVYARQVYIGMPPFGARSQIWRRLPQGGSKLSEYGELGLMMQNLGPLYSPAAQRPASDGRIAQTDSEID
jgi:sorting and assembly machinery component 37